MEGPPVFDLTLDPLSAKMAALYLDATPRERALFDATVFKFDRLVDALKNAARLAHGEDLRRGLRAERKADAARSLAEAGPRTPAPARTPPPGWVLDTARTVARYDRPVSPETLARLYKRPPRDYAGLPATGLFADEPGGLGLTAAGRAALAADRSTPPPPPHTPCGPAEPTAGFRVAALRLVAALRGDGGWPVPAEVLARRLGASNKSVYDVLRCRWFGRLPGGFAATRAGLAALVATPTDLLEPAAVG